MSDAVRIEQRAAEWLARREGGTWDAVDESALAAWLDECMAHRAAFWRLEHGWRAADRVAALGEERTYVAVVPARRWRSPVWGGAIAAALLLTVGTGVWQWRERAAPSTNAMLAYATRTGVQREVQLADGSRVQLNTASRLRAAPGRNGREVWLDRGEAFFDIVHRPDQPFLVHAGSRTVTVLGTRFTVRRQGERVIVAVISGRVRVDDANATGGPIRSATVGKGDVAIARGADTLVATAAPARVEAMTAWRDGRIEFDQTRLADAVAEFNRYQSIPIRVIDPAAAELRIGGSFRTTNSAAFLQLLERGYGLRVIYGNGETRIVS